MRLGIGIRSWRARLHRLCSKGARSRAAQHSGWNAVGREGRLAEGGRDVARRDSFFAAPDERRQSDFFADREDGSDFQLSCADTGGAKRHAEWRAKKANSSHPPSTPANRIRLL